MARATRFVSSLCPCMRVLHSLVLPTNLSLCVETTRGRARTQVMRLERERERERIKRLGATSSATAARGWHKVGRAEGTGDSPISIPRPRPGPDPLWSCCPPQLTEQASLIMHGTYTTVKRGQGTTNLTGP